MIISPATIGLYIYIYHLNKVSPASCNMLHMLRARIPLCLLRKTPALHGPSRSADRAPAPGGPPDRRGRCCAGLWTDLSPGCTRWGTVAIGEWM